MPRTARIVYCNYPHHIVQRGNNHQRVFFDDSDRVFYLALLKKYAVECSCKIKAYCLMENHVHVILVPQHNDSLAKMMQKVSLVFTQYVNKKYKRTGRLWECRFYSAPVDTDAYLWTVCRYIEKNPVRAKMVEKSTDYRLSSAKVNTSQDCHDKIVDPIWRDYVSFDEYVKFFNQSDEEDQIRNIRKCTRNGMPIGQATFVKAISDNFGIILDAKHRGRPRENRS